MSPASPTPRDPFRPPDVLELIDLPTNQDAQWLAAMIFSEASPRAHDDGERYAMAWSIINSVAHTLALCSGDICPNLTQKQRDAQCQRDTTDLGNDIPSSIRAGSQAYNSDRWNLVMQNDSLKPLEELLKLPELEHPPLARAIQVAAGALGGQHREYDIMRFNQAHNHPPSVRWEWVKQVGRHSFYKFKEGRECG